MYLSTRTGKMDPQFFKGLQQIKECLEQGILTPQEFDDQKRTLMDLYPVTRGDPLPTGVPQSPESQPLKVVSDPESRNTITGRHRWGYRKCCKCPLLVIGHFPDFLRQYNLKQRHRWDCVCCMTGVMQVLCLLHDGSHTGLEKQVLYDTHPRSVLVLCEDTHTLVWDEGRSRKRQWEHRPDEHTYTPTQRERRVHITCHTPSCPTDCPVRDTCPTMSRADAVNTTSSERIRSACVVTVLNRGKTILPDRVVVSENPSDTDARQ